MSLIIFRLIWKRQKWGCEYPTCAIITNSCLQTTLLHLLVFPFVYRFHSRIEAVHHSSFANDQFRRISASFQLHFKICLFWLLYEKECSFYTYLFCCTELKWMFIISTAFWVTGWDTGSVAPRAKSELPSSTCEWTRIWTTYLECRWNNP
jgi:hypothetical protein